MADFGETNGEAVGRKDHLCELCFEAIPKGEVHAHFKGKWKGEWQNWRAHGECYDACDTNEGFEPGEMIRPKKVSNHDTEQ